MLKCNIKHGGIIKVKATGTAKDLTVETAVAVKMIHQSIHQQNPEAAKAYKLSLIGMLLDPDSPVWKENNHEEHPK